MTALARRRLVRLRERYFLEEMCSEQRETRLRYVRWLAQQGRITDWPEGDEHGRDRT